MPETPKDIFLLKFAPSIDYPNRPAVELPINGSRYPDSAEYQ